MHIALFLLFPACTEELDSEKQTPLAHPESGVLEGITEVHNVIRREHGVPELSWDEALVTVSEEWIAELDSTNNCQMEHNWDSPYGENLFKANYEADNEEVVLSWASEEAYYDYESNECQAGEMCGHYTQLIWSTTEHVGCAMLKCSTNEYLWMCNYDPAGNWVGERPY